MSCKSFYCFPTHSYYTCSSATPVTSLYVPFAPFLASSWSMSPVSANQSGAFGGANGCFILLIGILPEILEYCRCKIINQSALSRLYMVSAPYSYSLKLPYSSQPNVDEMLTMNYAVSCNFNLYFVLIIL